MNLIDRYVHEVGRHLPRSQRSDVEAELRSLLQDMVEDRAQTKVDKADEETIATVLQEFGSPKEVAASYQPKQQYLIGPNMYPLFKLVLTIVASVITVMTAVGIVLTAASSEAFLPGLVRAAAQAIPAYISTMLSTLATMVVVFAVLERVLPDEDFSLDDEEEWDPHDLPQIDESSRINRAELIGGIVFSVVLLVLLNLFPQWVGIIYFEGDQVQTIPFLSQNFYDVLLPWVNLLLVVSVGFNVYQLYVGRKTTVVRWLDVGQTLLTAVVIYIFITRGPVIGFANVSDGFDNLASLLNTLARIGLPILFIIILASAGKKVYDIWRQPVAERPPEPAGKMG